MNNLHGGQTGAVVSSGPERGTLHDFTAGPQGAAGIPEPREPGPVLPLNYYHV